MRAAATMASLDCLQDGLYTPTIEAGARSGPAVGREANSQIGITSQLAHTQPRRRSVLIAAAAAGTTAAGPTAAGRAVEIAPSSITQALHCTLLLLDALSHSFHGRSFSTASHETP